MKDFKVGQSLANTVSIPDRSRLTVHVVPEVRFRCNSYLPFFECLAVLIREIFTVVIVGVICCEW